MNKKTNFARLASVPLLVLLLVASLCGGTGNETTPPASVPTPSASAGETPAATPAAEPPLATFSAALHRVPLSIDVGGSLLLSTQKRLRRVYVANPAVVESVTANPHQLVLTAKAAGKSSLALWTEDGTIELYDLVANVDVASAKRALSQAFPGEPVAVEAQEGRLLLTGSASSQAVIDAAVKLLSSYTKDVVSSAHLQLIHPPQVNLKVRIAEVDRSKLDQLGINLLSNAKTSGASSTQQFGVPGLVQGLVTPSDLLNIFIYNSSINLGAVLKDLQQNQVMQVLAEPNLTAISGQTARFLSGGEFPFPVVQGSSGGLTSITVQFRPFGVRLDFTPLVNPDNTIRLKVAPEVSALDYNNAVVISGYTIPAISTRRAETEIELKDGQSFAISGLLDHRTTEKLSKMPGIGDIPILGALFKSREINKSLSELVVIITPVLVDPLANPTAEPAVPKPAVPNMEEAQFDQALKSKPKQPKEPVNPAPAGH